MPGEIEVLNEIRDLLQVIAEPALAVRDAKRRAALRAAVGGSTKRAKCVQLMDGSRSQSAIAKESGLDPGNVSRLVKGLAAAQLIATDQRRPMVILKVPGSFFDGDGEND